MSTKSKKLLKLINSENKNEQLDGVINFLNEAKDNPIVTFELLEHDILKSLININNNSRG
jgi:hypothetical protein